MNQAVQLEGNSPEELLAAFQAQTAAVQGELMQAIAEAQAAGDMQRVTELSVAMQEQMQALSEAYATQVAALGGGEVGTSPYNFPCSLDLDLTVYDGDRDGYIDFENDPNVQQAQQALEERFGQYNSRKQLLKTCLKLTPAMAPNIYAIGERCQNVLGMQAKLEFYVYQDNQFNASIYPPSEDRIYIMLSSGLLENFKDDELTFVIGHELGHTLFHHHKYPAAAIMDHGEGALSPMHAIKLFAWGRAAEISADRIGLICAQDFTAAARSFFKLSSGVTTDSLSFQLDEYVRQFVDLSAEMAGEQMDPQDWYSTHPFSPLRIKALEIFNRSETYHTLSGNNPNFTISEEEMEQEIAQFMSLMEPSHLDQNEEIGGDIHTYLFLAGFLIAMADGHVDDEEVQMLGRIVHKDIFAQCIESIQDADEEGIRNHVCHLADKLNHYLSPMQKLNLIRDLCLIATADGEIHQNEMHTLYNLCHIMNIQPDFADQVIHDSRAELD
jgi:uncharacterized tellurite resistance protein B-like protein